MFNRVLNTSLVLDAISWSWKISAIFSLDGTFTELLSIVETTCYANEFRDENCSSGEVGEQRQCQNGSCVGLDGRRYLPNEYEIVYRNCTLIDFCPYPPRKHFKRFWGEVNLKVQSCKLIKHWYMLAYVFEKYPVSFTFQLFIIFAVIYPWNLLFSLKIA